MKLYVLTQTNSVLRSRAYTLAEAARLDDIPDDYIDELAELHVGQRWMDPDGDWWERIA